MSDDIHFQIRELPARDHIPVLSFTRLRRKLLQWFYLVDFLIFAFPFEGILCLIADYKSTDYSLKIEFYFKKE